MSKRCFLCENKINHNNLEDCPYNYDGSSRGMEATGAAVNVNALFSRGCYIKNYVMDDDSLTKAILKWSFHDQEAKAREDGMVYKWPKDKSGRKKKDTGRLHIRHPLITWLADKNHRVCTCAGPFFKAPLKTKR